MHDTCRAEGCDLPRYGKKDHCRKHHERLGRNGTLVTKTTGPKRAAATACTSCASHGQERPAITDGLCPSHYRRRQQGQDHLAPLRAYVRGPRPCSVDGCDEPVRTHDLCASHYSLKRRHGTPLAEKAWELRDPECSVEGCARPHQAKGYCVGHYQRVQKHGDPGSVDLAEKETLGETCKVDGCVDPPQAKNLCGGHYGQWRAGLPFTEKRKYAPAGTGYVNNAGYRVIRVDGKSVLEHRHIVEQALGRPLLAHENVHHVRGDKLDNTLDGPFVMTSEGRLRSGSLELWSTAQPAGQEIGPKVDWGLDEVETYLNELDEVRLDRLITLAEKAKARRSA